MNDAKKALLAAAMLGLTGFAWSGERGAGAVTVPVTLDHNRMLVDAEIQRKDGTWRKVRLWVDTGNPDFLLSDAVARDLGIDVEPPGSKGEGSPAPRAEVPPPAGVRIGGMPLNFEGVKSIVLSEPRWLFSTMHNDANLPATVLKRYRVVFDYPKRQLTLAEPGALRPRGTRASASVHPQTGIVQIDAAIGGGRLSFALDNGASYSFASAELVEKLSRNHPAWSRCSGAIGCANIWGWWPGEPEWAILRVPEIRWGPVRLTAVGLVGLPSFFPGGAGLGEWYSKKSARPVDGILGPNAFAAYRVEIDYAGGAVYFEKGQDPAANDMDLVGLTLRPEADGGYSVIGIARKDGKPTVERVQAGDRLLQVGPLQVLGATMGTVADALRGRPGEARTLVLEREGARITVEAKVERFL